MTEVIKAGTQITHGKDVYVVSEVLHIFGDNVVYRVTLKHIFPLPRKILPKEAEIDLDSETVGIFSEADDGYATQFPLVFYKGGHSDDCEIPDDTGSDDASTESDETREAFSLSEEEEAEALDVAANQGLIAAFEFVANCVNEYHAKLDIGA